MAGTDNLRFYDVCNHMLTRDEHCEACCFDMGDAEREMCFDPYEPDAAAPIERGGAG